MRSRFHATVFVGSVVVATLSSLTLVSWLLWRAGGGAPPPGAILESAAVALMAGALLALIASWCVAAPLGRRIRAISGVATRYAGGDLSRPTLDYGSDEVGMVARLLDSAVQALGRRVEDLSRDRALMEAILSGMAEGVLVIDRQGRVRLVNRAAQDMLRVDASATGRPYVEVIRHPEIAAQLGTTLRGEETDSRELALARDPSRTFISRAAPVASRDGGAVLVLHDITDLRRADRIRQDFVANVSHELRTPLTAIRGYVEALLDEPPGHEQARDFLEIIARHSARMERLVTDLLRLARLDARQEALDIAACDVRQLLSAIVADLTPLIGAKRQRVVIDVPADARVVDADPVKLHDVVRNLVENAASYSPEDAELRLATSRKEDAFIITVSDTGPGIPHQDLTRVFERFYRVDQSRSRPGGTGLGLAIVRHLVELHGGQATASNHPSGGAVFTVSLPFRPS